MVIIKRCTSGNRRHCDTAFLDSTILSVCHLLSLQIVKGKNKNGRLENFLFKTLRYKIIKKRRTCKTVKLYRFLLVKEFVYS